MRIIAAAVAMVFVLGGPASAGTPEDPELEDTCGVGTHMVQEQVAAPWLDLCKGWFGTLAGAQSGIQVNLQVADLAANRTDSQYWVSWAAGGCGFTVTRFDGGTQLQPGEAASRLAVQCDPGHEVPCPTPLKELGYRCFEWEEALLYDVTGTFSEAGNTLSWALQFDGELAQYADHHAPRSRLKSQWAMSAIGANSEPITGPGRCTRQGDEPWQCTNQVTDWIPSGGDYIVGS